MSTAKRYFRHLWREWQKDEVTRHAATLAYFAVFSLPAFLLVILFIASIFVDEADVRTRFFAQIQNIAGESLASFLSSSIESAHRSDSSILINVLGIAFLLFASVGIFREIEIAVNKILNVKPVATNGILALLRSYALSFVLLIVAATILITSLAAGSVLLILQTRLTTFSSLEIVQLSTLNQLLSYIALGTLFFVMYRFLPSKTFPLKAILIGTISATTLFVTGTFLLTLYLSQASIGHAYGVASSVLVLLLWIFYSANVFLLGAEIIDAYDRIID